MCLVSLVRSELWGEQKWPNRPCCACRNVGTGRLRGHPRLICCRPCWQWYAPFFRIKL